MSIHIIHVNSWHPYQLSLTFSKKFSLVGGREGRVKYVFLGLGDSFAVRTMAKIDTPLLDKAYLPE
jgi:hypothetical protein